MLPGISDHKRRPPMGESFHSMGRMTGAAGFKRDSVASRGGAPDPGLTGFTYNDPNTPMMRPEKENAGSNVKSPIDSARRSFTQRMGAAAPAEVAGEP